LQIGAQAGSGNRFAMAVVPDERLAARRVSEAPTSIALRSLPVDVKASMSLCQVFCDPHGAERAARPLKMEDGLRTV